jgi:2-dehydropantoate 2-reductase
MDGSTTVYEIFATTRLEEVPGKSDLAIIFTKSYHTRDAAETASALLEPAGLALTLQNGIGNIEVIRDVLGVENAVAGVTSHGGDFVGPGTVRHAGKGPTHIAFLPGKGIFLDETVRIFNEAGIETTLSENVDSLVWGKLIVNVGINALTAIFRVKNGIIGKTPECVRIMQQAVEEAVSVADALGIVLPYKDPFERVLQVCEATAANRASMLQDILKGGRTEIGAINGAIVDRGEALGIQTPVNRFLSQTVQALEATAEHRILQ